MNCFADGARYGSQSARRADEVENVYCPLPASNQYARKTPRDEVFSSVPAWRESLVQTIIADSDCNTERCAIPWGRNCRSRVFSSITDAMASEAVPNCSGCKGSENSLNGGGRVYAVIGWEGETGIPVSSE